jgi:lactoylglutathione lyase
MSDSAATHGLRPTSWRWTHIALRVSDIDATIAWYQRYTALELLDKREDADGFRAWLGHSDSGEHPFVLVLAQFFEGRDPFAPTPLAKLNHFGMLEDPDGNLVEFSLDQGVYEKVHEVWG